jgi:uncharacterized alkaline shock family protein YloU
LTLTLINRVLVIVFALILIGIITTVAITPQTLRVWLANLEEANLLLRLAVVVVLNIVILILLYLTLRGPKKVVNGLAVRAPGAYTDVSIESARKLILSAVENVPDVVSASATVKAVNGKADVDLDVQVSGMDVHIPRKQQEINRALKQVINKQLGLEMRGRPRVHIYLHGEKPPAPPTAVTVVAEPAVEKKSLLEPEIATPPPVVPAKPDIVPATEKDDTLLKDDVPAVDKKDEKPGLINGLFGSRQDEASAKEETSDDWLNTYIDEKDKEKPAE